MLDVSLNKKYSLTLETAKRFLVTSTTSFIFSTDEIRSATAWVCSLRVVSKSPLICYIQIKGSARNCSTIRIRSQVGGTDIDLLMCPLLVRCLHSFRNVGEDGNKANKDDSLIRNDIELLRNSCGESTCAEDNESGLANERVAWESGDEGVGTFCWWLLLG